jgi:hypothetical protein
MTKRSPFGARLYRLLAHRPTSYPDFELALDRTAAQVEVPRSELDAVLDGAEPSSPLVRRLAPELGLHTADLFVIAGLAVPLDLAPAHTTVSRDVGKIVRSATRMDADQRGRWEEVVRSLPVRLPAALGPTDDLPESPGALLIRLLGNRNIRPHNGRIVRDVGGGPYVSDSTIWSLGAGRVPITPRYVTAFAHLLGYPPDVMVAVTGVGPVISDLPVHPASGDLAALAWRARRLDEEQILQVFTAADELMKNR